MEVEGVLEQRVQIDDVQNQKIGLKRKKRSRSRSKERKSRRRSSRSRSRDRRRRSKSKEKRNSKKSSRHRSKSRDRERGERKRSRSKERDRESKGNRTKDSKSLRERTPESFSGDARVTRDYDQEEAGFESIGDIKQEANVDKPNSSNELHKMQDLLTSTNLLGAVKTMMHEGSRVMDISVPKHQYNNSKYFNGASKKMEKGHNPSSSRDPRISRSKVTSPSQTMKEREPHFNGKSRDRKLSPLHEDSRGEAMGTEDMEISNSP